MGSFGDAFGKLSDLSSAYIPPWLKDIIPSSERIAVPVGIAIDEDTPFVGVKVCDEVAGEHVASRSKYSIGIPEGELTRGGFGIITLNNITKETNRAVRKSTKDTKVTFSGGIISQGPKTIWGESTNDATTYTYPPGRYAVKRVPGCDAYIDGSTRNDITSIMHGPFMREVFLSKLSDLGGLSPCTIYVSESGEDGGDAFIMMKAGYSLRWFIGATKGKVDKKVVEMRGILAKKIIDAISILHKNSICHCDIKPDNIIFTGENGVEWVLFIDFGISWTPFIPHYRPGTALYTDGYRCPALHATIPDMKMRYIADMWACAVTLLELFSTKTDWDTFSSGPQTAESLQVLFTTCVDAIKNISDGKGVTSYITNAIAVQGDRELYHTAMAKIEGLLPQNTKKALKEVFEVGKPKTYEEGACIIYGKIWKMLWEACLEFHTARDRYEIARAMEMSVDILLKHKYPHGNEQDAYEALACTYAMMLTTINKMVPNTTEFCKGPARFGSTHLINERSAADRCVDVLYTADYNILPSAGGVASYIVECIREFYPSFDLEASRKNPRYTADFVSVILLSCIICTIAIKKPMTDQQSAFIVAECATLFDIRDLVDQFIDDLPKNVALPYQRGITALEKIAGEDTKKYATYTTEAFEMILHASATRI